MTITGLDRLISDNRLQKKISGRFAVLCHNASIDKNCRESIGVIKTVFGERMKAIFSPQHGLFGEDQDNMVESSHFIHPFFKIPVHSLYSETRKPTSEMLSGIDQVLVDLQDIGSRPYTFIYTMTMMMEQCGKRGIQVIVLDRPNPIGGNILEVNILDKLFRTFIGFHPLPMRHAMTIGEIAKFAVEHWDIRCDLEVIKMTGWKRKMCFEETGLPWSNPSPNMPSPATAAVFPAIVLLEGTNLSEGRGTTRPFEIFGHPSIDPYQLLPTLNAVFQKEKLSGFTLRPLFFKPTFDKYAGKVCGGFQLHITDKMLFRAWRTGQVLLRELYHCLQGKFTWRQPPFEYEKKILPIDMLNGTNKLRVWVENYDSTEQLLEMEAQGIDKFLNQRKVAMLYGT
jgi:uncharacterized protein YbbC (DUF1343 family)